MSAKVAIVAGAGGALGQATAVALSAGGLAVVAVDRNERGLGDLPDDIHREVADATDPAVATRLVDRIAGQAGPPDVLVNTIGAFRPGRRAQHDSRDAAARDPGERGRAPTARYPRKPGHVPGGGDRARERARGHR
jgi:NAD(P)-dependent dehydrogenase (short-subunit alcohol dehydrogenase family)